MIKIFYIFIIGIYLKIIKFEDIEYYKLLKAVSFING